MRLRNQSPEPAEIKPVHPIGNCSLIAGDETKRRAGAMDRWPIRQILAQIITELFLWAAADRDNKVRGAMLFNEREKISIFENGKAPKELHVEEGTIKDVSYAGMITRYLVDLEAGGELQVVRQNLETSSDEAQAQRGRKVKIGWRADQTVAVEGEEEGK